MNASRTVLLTTVATTAVLAVSAAHGGPPAAARPAAWKQRMDTLALAIRELLADVSSSERSARPDTRARMIRNAKVLAELSHQVEVQKDKPQPDPSLAYMAASLGDEAREAEWALRQGQVTYARGVLFNVLSACLACHTRNATGPVIPSDHLIPKGANLTDLEHAALLAATRDFDGALARYDAILKDPDAPIKRGLDWDRAASSALALTVRQMRSPQKAAKVAERVLASRAAPLFMRQDAVSWQHAIDEWAGEPPITTATESALHERAVHLMDLAQQGYAGSSAHAQAVRYLRASSLLHDQLSLAPQGPLSADALLRLGLCYRQMVELEQWTLHPTYFEACVRRAPHTERSEQCYALLENSLYGEYAGSGNAMLPVDVQDRLRSLRALALRSTDGGAH